MGPHRLHPETTANRTRISRRVLKDDGRVYLISFVKPADSDQWEEVATVLPEGTKPDPLYDSIRIPAAIAHFMEDHASDYGFDPDTRLGREFKARVGEIKGRQHAYKDPNPEGPKRQRRSISPVPKQTRYRSPDDYGKGPLMDLETVQEMFDALYHFAKIAAKVQLDAKVARMRSTVNQSKPFMNQTTAFKAKVRDHILATPDLPGWPSHALLNPELDRIIEQANIFVAKREVEDGRYYIRVPLRVVEYAKTQDTGILRDGWTGERRAATCWSEIVSNTVTEGKRNGPVVIFTLEQVVELHASALDHCALAIGHEIDAADRAAWYEMKLRIEQWHEGLKGVLHPSHRDYQAPGSSAALEAAE